jgi:hypothetical protein
MITTIIIIVVLLVALFFAHMRFACTGIYGKALVMYQDVKSGQQFEKIEFIHIYRNENKRADYLSNVGLLSNLIFEKI